MRRRGEFGMPEQRLDDPDVHAALQQVRREGMAQRMQRDRLGDASRSRRLLEQPRNLSRREMPATIAGKKHAIGSGHAPVVDGRAFGPPRAQQAQDNPTAYPFIIAGKLTGRVGRIHNSHLICRWSFQALS